MTEEEREKELYDALGRIGRIERKIDPSNLESYPALLQAPEVQRWAGASASPERLANAAHEALRDAIRNLSGDTRIVAEAVLASNDTFAGLTVDQRKRLLAESPHVITADRYKRLRPEALMQITRRLLREVKEDPRVPLVEPELANRLEDLGRLAADVHYSALSCLFVADLVPQLSKAGFDCKNFLVPFFVSENQTYLLGRYFTCAYGVFRPDQSAPPPFPSSPTAGDKLLQLIFRLRQHSPLDLSDQEEVDSEVADGLPFHRGYGAYNKWQRWCAYVLDNQTDEKARSQFAQMLTAAGEISQHIGEHIQYRVSVLSLARSSAYDNVVRCFNVGKWDQLLNGHTLESLLDQYYDKHSIC